MTNKIYETDSYIKQIETEVVRCYKDEKGIFISLKDTIFFPEEGGQHADIGTITYNGHEIKVIDGIITGNSNCNGEKRGNEDIDIRYRVEEEIPAGTIVSCSLDWELRFDRMQNHSGEHVLTGVIHNKYGFDNVGFHLSDDGFVTLDLNGILSYEQVIEMEKVANEIIYTDMPIKDTYPTKDELRGIEYRSKIDIDGQVRLITVGDKDSVIDICACCAPHVKSTGAIGIIKVISVINWKGGIRISMLCGRRALEYINHEHDIITDIARKLSTNIDDIADTIYSNREEISELKVKLAKSMEQDALTKVEGLTEDGPMCVFLAEDFPPASMKNIYNVLAEKTKGYCGVFCGNDISGYRYNAGSSTKDSKELAGRLREELGAKGGGSSEMIQGKITNNRSDIEKFFIAVNSN